MPTPSLTPPPTPPSRADPANFASRGDAFLGWFSTTYTELTTFIAWVAARAAEILTWTNATQASENAAATSASTAIVQASAANAAATAAQSAAIAAAAGAGLPTASLALSRRVLRNINGLVAWGPPDTVAIPCANAASSINRLAASATLDDNTKWAQGSNIVGVARVTGGPNGIGAFTIVATGSPGNQSLTSVAVAPVQGQQRTAAVWFQGATKPTAGNLIQAYYRDVSNNIQQIGLPFSHASVIADGLPHRCTLTWTHAGSNVGALSVLFCVDLGAGSVTIADPSLNDGASAGEYVATGQTIVAESGARLNLDTSTGTFAVYLPASPQGGDWVDIVDYGRAADVNNITVIRNGNYIANLNEDMTISTPGVAVRLIFDNRKGWIPT